MPCQIYHRKPKRLQYLAAETAGTTAPQKAGHGAITDKEADS